MSVYVNSFSLFFNIHEQMLSKYGSDPSITAMVDRMDWVIMPVFNVDGYVYTHTSVSPLVTLQLGRITKDLEGATSRI